MGEKKVKLKIKNLAQLKNYPKWERIVVELEATYSGMDEVTYRWSSMGQVATTSIGSAKLVLPAWYCGHEIKVSVAVVKKMPFSSPWFTSYNAVILNPQEESHEDDLHIPYASKYEDSKTFTPQCDVEFKSLKWYQHELIRTKVDMKVPQLVGRYYSVEIEVCGLNTQSVTGGFYSGGKHLKRATIICREIEQNLLYAHFYASPQYLEGDDEKQITLELFYGEKKTTVPETPYVFTIKKEKDFQRVRPIDSTPIQPVLVGPINIVENNFNPCKYTAIEAKAYSWVRDKPITKTIFDELRSVEIAPFNIIGGKNKIDIELLNYNTKKCKNEQSSHKENYATLVRIENQETTIYEIPDSGHLEFFLGYDYGIYSNPIEALVKLPWFFVHYFWPTRKGLMQTYYLHLPTCRHDKNALLNIFPDIEFDLGFVFNSSIGESWLTSKGIIVDEYELCPENIDEGELSVGFDFQLAFEALYNDKTKINLGGGIKEKIVLIFKILALLKNYLGKTFGVPDNQIDENETTVPTQYDRYTVFKAFIKKPSVALGIKWKGEYNNNEVCTEIGLYAKLDPLLCVGLYIDLIEAAKYAGPWGVVISRLRRFLAIGNVNFQCYIIISGNAKIEGEFPLTKILSSDDITLIEGTAFVEFRVGLEIKAEGKVFVVIYKFEAKFHGKGGIFYKLTLGSDEQGLYYQHSVGNTSIEVAGVINASVSVDNKGTKTQGRAVDVETTGSKEGSAGIEKTCVLLPQLIWFGDEADKEKSNAWGKHRFDKDN